MLRCSPDINDLNADLISNRNAPVRKKAKFIKPLRIGGRRSISALMELLDSRVRPGVTRAEFKDLFVRCECGLILTRRSFWQHKCPKEIIDLTGEDTEPVSDD